MSQAVFSGAVLFVPGNRAERFDKAITSGASHVIIDLEDGVPEQLKASARHAVAEWSRIAPAVDVGLWLRISGDSRTLTEELLLVTRGPFSGTVVPKADDPERLSSVHKQTRRPVVAMVESARGIIRANELAGTPGVAALAVGEQDLIADLGLDPRVSEEALIHHRSTLVIASAAAGIEPPLGPVWTTIPDLDGLELSTERLRRIGFGSRAVIHPSHVAKVNEIFAPSAERLEWANRVLARSAMGNTAFVDGDQTFVDEAVLRSARRIAGRR